MSSPSAAPSRSTSIAAPGAWRLRKCVRGARRRSSLRHQQKRCNPASIAITDNAVGYATEVCDPQERGLQGSPCITIVGRNGGRVATITSAVDPTPPRSQITRLRIAASGAFAWISCHRKGPKAGEADPATQPGCLTTGRRHYVYALPADAPDRSTPVRLASATGISPRTLSIGKRRVTWRVGKRLRSAPIPPPTPATASPPQ